VRFPRREDVPHVALTCFAVALAAVAIAGAAISAGCANTDATTTSVSARPSTTVPAMPGSSTTSMTLPGSTSTTAAGAATETTAETIVEKPAKPPAELLYYQWSLKGYWTPNPVDDLSANDADFRPEGARIVGDPYFYLLPGGAGSYVAATGEDGKIVVFSLFRDGPDSGSRATVKAAAPTGRPLRELLGGRAFNSPVAVAGFGSDKTVHVFATDTADNLIHFWFKAGALQLNPEDIKSENLTSATGIAVARVGSARTAKDGATLEVCALNPDDELLYFSLAPGGSWSAENPSKQTGRVANQQATFFTDPLGASDTTIASSCALNALLLFRRGADGAWTVEDITQETSTAKPDPEVRLGGWLSWWDWESQDYWDPSRFQNPLAILTVKGHFQLLERASMLAPWEVTDVSALTGVSFAADGGGDSIIRLRTPPGASPNEAHFAGVDKEHNLIHFWLDTNGKWHAEDLTAKTGQKLAYPLGESSGETGLAALGAYAAIHIPGPIAAGTDTLTTVSGVDPDGRLIVLWAPSSSREWQVFDATAAMGYKVRGPDIAWSDSFRNNLILTGSK
jgi:hypothetical protein